MTSSQAANLYLLLHLKWNTVKIWNHTRYHETRNAERHKKRENGGNTSWWIFCTNFRKSL